MGRPYVHIKQTHCFNPVPIGAHAYPRQVHAPLSLNNFYRVKLIFFFVQVFEIHNSGDSGVGYTVDTRPLDDLQTTNYLMPILKCLQLQGEIPSGCSVSLEFVFSPLEAKKYIVSNNIISDVGGSPWDCMRLNFLYGQNFVYVMSIGL